MILKRPEAARSAQGRAGPAFALLGFGGSAVARGATRASGGGGSNAWFRMTNKSAAIRYARALFDVALQEKADLERAGQELADFDALLTQQPVLKKVLLNPAVPAPRKRGAMVELTARANMSPVVGKLLILLAERDRLIILPDLVASYSDRLLSYRQVVRAEVTTATPLAAAQAEMIERQLALAIGGSVVMQTRVEPSIVGGLVAKLGSTVYDGSITRQLQKMRDRLAGNTR